MFFKNTKIIIILFLFYQSHVYSKSISLEDFNHKSFSKYFSGVVAFENKNNSKALDFFNSSKILLDYHDPYFKRYISSLVLEKKIPQAINIIKKNKGENKSNFFDAYLLLIIGNLKKNNLHKAEQNLINAFNLAKQDRFNLAILESLKQYIFVFKEKKILNQKKTLGNLSIISETFQRCYLGDQNTDSYFSNLINKDAGDFNRYIFFYLSYLVENNRINDAQKITDDLKFINSPLLLSQAKSWIDEHNPEKILNFFSCKNHNDIISEFLFLVSNLYSSEDNFEKSNFYLNLSNFLNPKFVFNLSLVAENYYLNKEYKKTKKVLKNFTKEHNFYHWYRVKKETQIIEKQRNKKESLNYITSEFKKINNPNKKILFDMANFYKNSEVYDQSINFYSKIIETMENDPQLKSDLLYRRGGSHERNGDYVKADKDLLEALKINPDDAYVLNYLAYSWLERDHKIDEAIKMLETAYALKKNDPYIIDSIGWAYYLTNNHVKAEKLLKKAVELMPEDPIVNDHYGDILWKLDRKIQARYFWSNVIKMEDTEKEILEKINIKMIEGL